MESVKWEYKVIKTDFYNEEELNRLGMESWELITTLLQNGYTKAVIFKRTRLL